MQPEPSGSSVRPSNGGRTILQSETSQKLKRKACGGDSRKKFLKVSADFVASPQTSYHRVDVSDVSTVTNGLASDSSPIAFKRGTVKNEKIYLDLKDGQLTQDLEKYITRFGGIVEKFLSKDITCVVTSRIDPKDTKAEDACLKKEAFSPCAAEKPKPDIYSSLGAMSRGKALLLRSNSTKASSSAVCGPVQFAHTWKIPVVEVSVLRNLLRKENNHRKQVSSQSSKPTVKKLDKPYVKVEDAMQMYNTSFKLFNSFPMSYLSPLDSLPCNGASQSNESNAKKKTKLKRIKKSGYCECCDVSFVDEKEHFNSRIHRAFVMRNENFASLDALVSKLPSLEKFALAVELDRKNLSSSRCATGVDPGLVSGLSDSQPQDHNSNPSFVHDVAVHGTKRRLYPGSSTNFKHDVKNRYDAQHVKSNGCVSPATVFTPSSSCPSRKPRTKKSQNTSSKSCTTRNSDSFHTYEKCEDDRHAGKLVSKSRTLSKDGRSDLNVDLNCPVDLSLPKSSTGVSLHQSSVSSLSTVSELNCADNTKISKVGKSVKISKGADKMKKLATSNCSDMVSDIGDPKMTRGHLISERMDSSLDLKLLATPVIANNAELRSPFLGGASTISREVSMSKDDDLDFSSDEVSDSADEKVDWKINLRNSCNKVLNILEDSNSSKDLAKDIPDDCSSNSQTKSDVRSNTQAAEACHTISLDKKEFNFSSLKSLSTPGSGQPAFGIQPDLDVTEKATVGKVSSKETSMSCRIKHGSVGIVRPWEMVSNKPEPNQLRMDKESHCNVESQQMLDASDSSGSVLPTDCDQRPNGNKVYRRIKSNCVTTATRTGKALLPEARHSDDDGDSRTKHSTEGNNTEGSHLNEDCQPEKAPSAERTAVKSDICAVESAVMTTVSCHVPEKILHSPAPVEVCITEQTAKAVTAEIVPAAVAESPTRFQDSPHSSSQSSIIVDVETCDERSENCGDKDQTTMPHYEPITPVKTQMPQSLEAGDKGIAFGSSYQDVDQRVIDQRPSWPMSPVLVNGQVVYRPTSVKDAPMSPTVSQQLVGTSFTNGHIIASQFLPVVSSEFQMQKRDSACSSLDSGYCASIKTVAVDSCPGSHENCTRDLDEGETCSRRELKCIPSHTENPVSSSPVPILAELPDPLPAAKQAENLGGCTSEIPINAESGSQCKTTDSVLLHGQSECPTSPVTATPKTPCSIPVLLQTEISDEVNLHFQGESAGSLAASVETLGPSSVSIQAANNDTSSPVLCQTENGNSSVSGQSTNHDSTRILSQAENSDSLIILKGQTENSDPGVNQEDKSESCAAVSNAESQSDSPSVEQQAINEVPVDEPECKDVLIEPTLPETNVEKVDALEDLASAIGQVQESSKAATVPEVQTYPDLMSGINELPEKSKMQMPDLLMETKNDTALDSPCSSNCPLASTEVHRTLSEVLPPGGSCYSGSEPMDVGFAELSEDFFTARSNPITFYGIDKSEEIPWTDNAWGSAANQTTETAAAAVDTTWPEELATIVQSNCPNDFASGCYVGLDNLMMSAPIGTPKCVSFSDDESCLPTTAKKENPPGVSTGLKTEIRSGNSVNTGNSVAEPSVLDDVVLTALSKILEDASKEWQAERQKSNSTDGETAALCSTLSVCAADKDLKEETNNKISGSHTMTSVEIPTSPPVVQTSKPIVPLELQSVQINEANEVISSEALCTVSESNLLENGSSSCIDGAQLDDRPVAQTLPLCTDDAEKELDETSKTEPFSTVSTPAGELDDLDRLMEMLKALNEETKCTDESELTSSCNAAAAAAAANSCQKLTKENSSELVLPNNFCDSFDGISFAKTHKTSTRQAAATGNPFHMFNDGSSIRTNHFSNDVNKRACQSEEKNKKHRCEWKMTYVSGLKFLFQRFLHSPDQSRCFGKYSIKSLGSERLAMRISKNKSRSNVKS